MNNQSTQNKFSLKHIEISREDTRAFISLAVAAVIIAFDIVIAITLSNRIRYQSRVISKKESALATLKDNNANLAQLKDSYTIFNEAPESVLGVSGQKNSQVVLDSLPSKYDFPALQTSMEQIITTSGLTINSISGTDNEELAEQSSEFPVPVAIPIELSVSGTYDNIKKLVAELERSIRPMNIREMSLSGTSTNLQASITIETYYQPTKEYGVKKEVVK